MVLSQEIELTSKDQNGNAVKLEWDALADRPGTSSYVASRGGRFDELHVVVMMTKEILQVMLEQSLKSMLTYQKHQMVNIQLVQHHTGEISSN